MKIIGPVSDLLECRCRTSLQIFITFAILCSVLLATLAENAHEGNTDPKKPDSIDFSKNEKVSTDCRTADGSIVGKNQDRVAGRSNIDGDKVSLDRFLENVLKAQDEFKWIDQAARGVRGNEKSHLNDAPSRSDSEYGFKFRGKRNLDRDYETMWLINKKKYADDGPHGLPQRVYLDSDTFKGDTDRDSCDLDSSQDGKGTMDDQPLKDWSRSENLRSSSDWMNFNKNPEPDGDRWINDYEATQKTELDIDRIEPGSRNQRETSDYSRSLAGANNFTPLKESEFVRREAKQKEAPMSLESLKEKVLELRKSLIEGDKKIHESTKNLNAEKSKYHEKHGKEEERGHGIHGKNKHERSNDIDTKSEWWGNPDAERFDLKKRENEDRSEGNNERELWRTRRTKVNNERDEGNPKLFYRAGFGVPYLDGKTSTEEHGRKRRSKGSSSDEKRYLNEAEDKNKLETGDTSEDPLKESKETGCNDQHDPDRENYSSNDLQGTNVSEQSGKSANVAVDGTSKKIPDVQWKENLAAKDAENHQRSDLSRKDTTENKSNDEQSMKNDEKDRNLGGNSLQTLGITANELQAVSTKTSASGDSDAGTQGTEGKHENVGSSQREQVIKVFEPQGHLYENSDGTKEVERIEPDEEKHGKLSQQLSEGKRSVDEPRNINIMVKSENQNLMKISNSIGNDRTMENSGEPFVLNTIDVKKKLILENEETPSKSVSTIFDIKIEKAQVDTSAKCEKPAGLRGNDKSQFERDADIFDSGKNKPNEELYGDMADPGRGIGQRNANEEQVKNAAESDKGSTQSGDNERSRNWYEDAARKQMGVNMDQSAAAGNYNDIGYKGRGEKDRFRDDETRFRDDRKKVESIEDFNNGALSSDESLSILRDKILGSKEQSENEPAEKKYSETLKVDGADNSKINDGFTRRKLFQYIDYSNENIENNDMNYGDGKENEEKEKNIRDRKDLSEYRGNHRYMRRRKVNPVKAKVNVLIRQKIDRKTKHRYDYKRKRRNPTNVIEYYDYDSDVQQQNHDASFLNSEQQTMKSYNDRNLGDPTIQMAGASEGNRSCLQSLKKKNENEEEVLKQQKLREKTGNKEPKEQFILEVGERPENVTESTGKPSNSSRSSPKVTLEEELSENQPGRLDQGEDNVSGINRGRLNERLKGEEGYARDEKTYLEGDKRKMILDMPMEYIINLDEQMKPETNNFLERDEDKSKIDPMYDELKKLYDWSDDELKIKPRLKGDQRMSYETEDKLGKNKLPEYQASDSSPRSSPSLLFILNESGKSEIHEKTDDVISARRSKDTAAYNGTESNYFALKSTDDMFKGGPEQNNSTSEKLREPSSIEPTSECRAQKVMEARNGIPSEKDAASWSLTDQRQYSDTDSRSPYETRKYLESQFPGERVQNIDHGKQTAISSQDLHESFVEPLDWIDDFDEDIRVRLTRGLKSVQEKNLDLIDKTYSNNTVTFASKEKIPDSFTRLQEINKQLSRVRRDVSPYHTFYDDVNQHQRDADGMDQYSTNRGIIDNRVHLPNPYENMDYVRSIDPSGRNEPAFDFSPEDERDSAGYEKIIRSVNKRKRQKHGRKRKSRGRAFKRRKKNKGRANAAKYTIDSRRKRHHKHDTKNISKKHAKKNKHKKHVTKKSSKSHHSNVKKSRMAKNVGKHHRHRDLHENVEDENTMNTDDDLQRQKIMLLLATNDVEDESQMDSAVHGKVAGKILEEIYAQVQKHGDLKASLGADLRNRKPEESLADTSQFQALNEDEVKHTDELIKKVLELLNRLIFDEVQRRTCVTLPRDLKKFLDWMLDVNGDWNSKQPSSTSLAHYGDIPGRRVQDKFLFQSFPDLETEADIGELHKKVDVMKKLIREYNALTGKEKTKVEVVHDYLVKQLDLLLEYIEAKQEAEKKGKLFSPFGKAGGKNGNVPEYRNAMGNATNGNYSSTEDTFPPLTNVNLSNVTLDDGDDANFYRNAIDVRRDARRKTRSLDKRSRHRSKRKKHKKKRKKKKKRKHRKKGKGFLSRWFRDENTLRKTMRRKRAYLDNDIWNPFDSGYEEPLTYSFMEMEQADGRRSNDEFGGRNGIPESTRYVNAAEETVKRRGIPESIKNSDGSAGNQVNRQKREETRSGATGRKSDSPFVDDEVLDDLPIKGKNQVEDELLLLNKRQAWKKENEEQLEEVAFGKDMRKGLKEKELFEKLTEIDKKNLRTSDPREKRRGNVVGIDLNKDNDISSSRMNLETLKNVTSKDCIRGERNNSNGPDEDKLRTLEEKINVYSDNDNDTSHVHEETRTQGQKVNAEGKATADEEVGKCIGDKLLAINCKTKLNGIKRTSRSNGGRSEIQETKDGKETTRDVYENELKNLKRT